MTARSDVLKLRAMNLDAAGDPSRAVWVRAALDELETVESTLGAGNYEAGTSFRNDIAEIIGCLANACKPLSKDDTRAVVQQFLDSVGL